MTLKLKIWRQQRPDAVGALADYTVRQVASDMSFLEMLDKLNDELISRGEDPVAFDYDCREGICGSCGIVIDGIAHGPVAGSSTCQLFMRHFRDGDTITLEPWRARAFPVIKDLVVDRTALDRIQQAGGYISVDTGSAPEANSIPVPKELAEEAMDSAACIQCGACVAACKNASASLFVGARVRQFSILPQGLPERERRVVRMVEQMEREGFGHCSNEAECEAVCPKQISTRNIASLVREYTRAKLRGY